MLGVRDFTPNEYVTSIFAIDLNHLWESGYRLILTDLDNTLVPWNHPDVSVELSAWIKQATALGLAVCILSNNHGPRVQEFAAKAGVPFVAAARKPRPDGYLEAMRRFGYTVAETVMVGDQVFTDVQGGNRLGLHTILVLPLHPREWWGTRLVRVLERFVLKRLVRHGLSVPAQKEDAQ